MKLLLEEMTRNEARQAFDQGAIVILPTASIEQHGDRLPLVVDTAVVDAVARGAAERARISDVPVVVAPVVHYGCSHHHLPWAGTMSLASETYMRVVTDLCRCLAHHGVTHILILNGHGGNHEANQVVAREMVNEANVVVAATSYWTLAGPALAEAGAAQVGPTPGHAGGFEASCMLALRPDLVKPSVATQAPLSASAAAPAQTGALAAGAGSEPENRIAAGTTRAGRGAVYVARAGAFERAGGISDDAARASAEAGRRFLDVAIECTADFLVGFWERPTASR